jgi:hypothetical protein
VSLRYLTPRDIANMTPAMRDRRTANWKGIIRGLQIEHNRRYHSHRADLDAAIRESRSAS